VSPAGINTCWASSGRNERISPLSRLMGVEIERVQLGERGLTNLPRSRRPVRTRIMLSGELLSLIASRRPPTIAIARNEDADDDGQPAPTVH